MKISFAHIRRMGHIKRWHLINTTRQQTLAEHSFMVAMITARIMQLLGVNMTEVHWRHALFHDAAEIAIGDIPTPAKCVISGPAVTRAEASITRAIGESFPWANTIEKQLLDVEFKAALECADMIEALAWIRENGVGAQSQSAIADITRGLENRILYWSSEVQDIRSVIAVIMEEWNHESTLL